MKSESRGNMLQIWSLSRRKVACLIALILWAAVAVGVATAQETNITLVIVSPKNQETIHDNTGKVSVTTAVSNGGALAAGSVIHVLLDGRRFGPPRHTTSFVLEGVERGEHALQVQLVDAAGNAIASSDSVIFYMWQASALFPGRS